MIASECRYLARTASVSGVWVTLAHWLFFAAIGLAIGHLIR